MLQLQNSHCKIAFEMIILQISVLYQLRWALTQPVLFIIKDNIMKFIILTATIMFFSTQLFAISQTDLLSAQNNYQAARTNYDDSNANLTSAKKALTESQKNLVAAKKALIDAQNDLKQKQNNLSLAKENVTTSAKNFTQATTIMNNTWNSLNPSKPQKTTNNN